MEEFDFYPPKPELIEHKPKSSLSLTIFSIVLFALVFLLLFEDQIAFIGYLMIVLFIHEMGHFVMMKLFGYKNVRMLFIPLMGAFVQGKKRNYSQREAFWVLIAGPFPGILIGFGMMMVAATWKEISWLNEPAVLFLLLNIINLLPLDPLDGGQMFKLFVKKNNELFLMLFALISSLVIIGVGFLIQSYLLIGFGFFMAIRVRSLQRKYQMHKDLSEDEVNYATTYKGLSNRDFLKIKEVLLENTPALKKFVDQVSEDESDPVLASQVNNVLITPLKKDASVFFKIFILLFWIFSLLSPLILWMMYDLKNFFNVI